MNRSAFHKQLARATTAAVLVVSAVGCATAPESLADRPTPPVEVAADPSEPPATDVLPDLADVSLRSPVANASAPVPARLEEPSPVWIDDTLARRTPLQHTELAAQLAPPEIDARVAFAGDRVIPSAPTTPRQPVAREPRAQSLPPEAEADTNAVARTPDQSAMLIEPRVPSRQRPASPAPARARLTAPERATASERAPAPESPRAPVVAIAPESSAEPGSSAAPTRAASVAGAGPVEAVGTRSTPVWNERAASVASGSEFSVVLPGSGWLYVGKEYGDGEISLLGKSRSGGDEVFRFRIGTSGDYGLWFQQQDSLSGSLLNERLSVRAAADEEASTITLTDLPEGSTLSPRSPAAAAGAEPATGRGAAAASGTEATDEVGTAVAASAPRDNPNAPDALARASRLLDEGESAEALAAFVDGADRGAIGFDTLDDGLLGRFVEAARSAFDAEAPSPVIRSFWRGVASSGSAAAPEARRALLEIATRAGDAAEIAAAVSTLEAAGEASADDMARAAEALLGAGRESDALPLLGRALTRGGTALGSVGHLEDDRLFALAQFLEQPGPDRDLRSAASLYRLILDDRPLSPHWDDSRSRLEYLRRHYFEVR